MNPLFILPISTCLTLILTGVLRHYALKRSLMDIPNERSSHSLPTPRGGGVSVVVVFLLLLILLGLEDMVMPPVLLALLGGGTLVALIGILDDLGHVSARWRLLSHFLGAGWALYWLGGLPPLQMFGATLELGWLGYFIATFYLVWLLNLYNFMDGIDGIASIEAITVSAGAAFAISLHNVPQIQWIIPLLLAAIVVGFLFWNFPVAKIFMGDGCSGFLGLMLGLLSFQAAWVLPQMFWVWIILLGVFIVDATLTLIGRILNKERIYEAHRSHAYQIAARRFNSHKVVSITVGLINLIWLIPIACLVSVERIDGVFGVFLAYIPLAILTLYFKIGIRSNE